MLKAFSQMNYTAEWLLANFSTMNVDGPKVPRHNLIENSEQISRLPAIETEEEEDQFNAVLPFPGSLPLPSIHHSAEYPPHEDSSTGGNATHHIARYPDQGLNRVPDTSLCTNSRRLLHSIQPSPNYPPSYIPFHQNNQYRTANNHVYLPNANSLQHQSSPAYRGERAENRSLYNVSLSSIPSQGFRTPYQTREALTHPVPPTSVTPLTVSDELRSHFAPNLDQDANSVATSSAQISTVLELNRNNGNQSSMSTKRKKSQAKVSRKKKHLRSPKPSLQMETENSRTTSVPEDQISLPTVKSSGNGGSSSKTNNKTVTDLRPPPIPPKGRSSNAIRQERRSKTKSTGRGNFDVPGDKADHVTTSLQLTKIPELPTTAHNMATLIGIQRQMLEQIIAWRQEFIGFQQRIELLLQDGAEERTMAAKGVAVLVEQMTTEKAGMTMKRENVDPFASSIWAAHVRSHVC